MLTLQCQRETCVPAEEEAALPQAPPTFIPVWGPPGSVTVQLRQLHLHIRSFPPFKAQWADGSKAQGRLGRDLVLLHRCHGTVSRPSCWLLPELYIWQRFVWQRAGCVEGSATAVTHPAAKRGATCLFARRSSKSAPPLPPGAHWQSSTLDKVAQR